jgi:hypothetical protein
MELRNSGRDPVQINDDGTHAILPVATHFKCNLDHAGVPVMWLRHADGKLRRDGFPAALLQRTCAVDERGRVHGAPGLAVVVAHRVQARRRGPCRKRERKREWVRSSRRDGRLRGQDKANWRSQTRRSLNDRETFVCTLVFRSAATGASRRLPQSGWLDSSFAKEFNAPSDGARGLRFEALSNFIRSHTQDCDSMQLTHRGSCGWSTQ